MPTRSARDAILSETATFDAKTDDLRVVIETPKGSRNKYDYDPDCDCLELAAVLPEGMSFPYDFGFVPSTLGEDGDPLDVLVLMDAPVIPGCIIHARPIGAVEAKQKAKGETWQRNDRLIAVAVRAQTHENIKSMDDLRLHLADEIKAFFIDYNRLRERKFKPLAESSPRKARKLIKKPEWKRSGSRAGRVRDQNEIVQSYHGELPRAVASATDAAILTERCSIAARRRLSEPPRSKVPSCHNAAAAAYGSRGTGTVL